MNQKSLAAMLRGVIIGVGICGALLCVLMAPGINLAGKPLFDFAGHRVAWCVLLWLCALPCYAALYISMKIADSIAADTSFSFDNARRLKSISILAFADGGVFFLANIVYLALGLSGAVLFTVSMLAVFVAVCICVAAAALSHQVYKAALLQQENELTI